MNLKIPSITIVTVLKNATYQVPAGSNGNALLQTEGEDYLLVRLRRRSFLCTLPSELRETVSRRV